MLQLKSVFLAMQKCFHVSVGGHALECLINLAINKSGEVTIGVNKLQSKAVPLASFHANRLVGKPPMGRTSGCRKEKLVGKRYSEQKTGCRDVLVC